jgi:hypothetical protein
MRGSAGSYGWVLGTIVLVALGIGWFVLQARRKAEPISIHSDRVQARSWSIPFSQIRLVREDRVSATQYIGGRPVLNTQRRLVIDTDSGPKVIAYEATYDVEAIKSALDTALARYRGR